MAEEQRPRIHPKREKAPEKPKALDIVPPREEQGTSDEIVSQGRIYYAERKIPNLQSAEISKEFLSTPEDKQDIQHGVVTYIDAADDDLEYHDREKHKPVRAKKDEKMQQDLTL